MDRPIASKEALDRYEEITGELAQAVGAARGRLMGMPTLYLGRKAFAGLFGDAMVFKLDGDDHAAAITLRGAGLFDPSGLGRPMKAWVQVPLEQASIGRTLPPRPRAGSATGAERRPRASRSGGFSPR